MGKWGKIIVALIVVVAIIIGGALMIMNKKATQNGANKVDQTAQNGSSPTSTAADVTITYDGQNFSLSAPSIKSGGTVKIANSSGRDLRFQSNPHPIHTDNPELNVGEIGAGESLTITLTNEGVWGFHNHLNHGQQGTITVE